MADEDFYQDQDAGPLDSALQARRIPHARSRKTRTGGGKGRKGTGGTAFNPLRVLGRYEIQVGTSGKKSRFKEDGPKSTVSRSWLEIHQLTSGEDGYLGTFDLDSKASGMFVLAGSRKVLAGIVEDLEQEADEESRPVEEDGTDDGDTDSDDDSGDAPEAPTEPSALEVEDEKINRRARAFEKNTFRNPKFWMRWKAHVQQQQPQPGPGQSDTATSSSSSSETNSGYLIFSSNDCDKFEGTITIEKLDWDNMKILGRKIHSRSTACPAAWGDFD